MVMKIARTGLRVKVAVDSEERGEGRGNMDMETMIEVVATERIAKTTDGGTGRDHDRHRRKLNLVLDHGPARLVVIGIETSYERTQDSTTPLDQIVQHIS